MVLSGQEMTVYVFHVCFSSQDCPRLSNSYQGEIVVTLLQLVFSRGLLGSFLRFLSPHPPPNSPPVLCYVGHLARTLQPLSVTTGPAYSQFNTSNYS